MRKTVRVLLANCPRLDDAACAYLILAQNHVQSVFEFEVYHLFVSAEYQKKKTDWVANALKAYASLPSWAPFRRRADRRYRARIEREFWPPLQNTLPLKTCIEDLEPYANAHDEWLNALSPNYGNWTMRPGPLVVLTETPLWGGYLSMVGSSVAVISLADWPKYTPPSVVEYALVQVQRAALRMVINPRIGSHYPTRGCVWDFAAYQPDARLCVVGNLCDACWALVRESVTETQRADLEKLLSHRWIGKTEETQSVASTMKRVFGFDLALTRGLSPSFVERVKEHLPSSVVTLLVAAILAIGTLVGALLTTWLRQVGWIK